MSWKVYMLMMIPWIAFSFSVSVVAFDAGTRNGYETGRDDARREVADHWWGHCMLDSYWGGDGGQPGVCGWEFEKALGFEDPKRR